MSTDIVVTGHRYANSAGVQVTSFIFQNGSNDGNMNATTGTENSDGSLDVNVNVNITNSSNEAKAKEAAQNIAAAVATIVDAALKLPPNTSITLPSGGTITVGDLLNDLKATKFIVTDNPNLGNNGVAKADHTAMTDTLYFAQFVEGAGPTSYSNSGWQGQGIIGVILHELGHLSAGGYANAINEINRFNNEMSIRKIPPVQRDFYGSDGADYNFDNESYAQGYASNAASVLGLDISILTNAYETNGQVGQFRGAEAVFDDHAGMYGY